MQTPSVFISPEEKDPFISDMTHDIGYKHYRNEREVKVRGSMQCQMGGKLTVVSSLKLKSRKWLYWLSEVK